MTVPEPFLKWLREELNKRNLSQTEASKRAGLNPNAISDIVNGQMPGLKTCKGLASLFNTPVEHVLRLVGHIPPRPERDSYFETLEALWGMIPDWKKRDMVMQLRSYIEDYRQQVGAEEAGQKTGGDAREDKTP